MNRVLLIAVAGCAATAVAALGQPGRGGTASAPGAGLTVKDFVRVEQGRGDGGGLSRSLARGPATLGAPNDFSGVYQIPEDADSPYAGWYARVSGAMIAVFPRGEYVATEGGAKPVIPANTRFFIGSVPLNAPDGGAKNEGRVIKPSNERVNNNADTSEPERPLKLAPDAPLPVTVETAADLSGVREAMGKLCGDPVYRANRVRELLERAGRVARADR